MYGASPMNNPPAEITKVGSDKTLGSVIFIRSMYEYSFRSDKWRNYSELRTHTAKGPYRGTSLLKKRHPGGPYSRTMLRLLWWS